MSYNYSFDIAAILLYLVMFAVYYCCKHIRNAKNTMFILLMLFCFLTPVLDILGSEVIVAQAPIWVVHLVNNLYYLTEQASNVMFLAYVLSSLEMIGSIRRLWQFLIVSPFVIISAIILTNPFHSLLYAYGRDRIWTYGPFRLVVIVFPMFYFAWAAYYCLTRKASLSRRASLIVNSIAVLNTTARIIQFFVPSALVYSFAVALGVLALLIGFQLNDKLVDPDTGLASRTYLAQNARKFIYNKAPFTTILIRVSDYDTLTTSYGIRPTDLFLKTIAEKLVSLSEGELIYKVSNNCFAMTLLKAYTERVDSLKLKVAAALDEPWNINGLDMMCSYQITSFSYPDQCPDRETFISYITYFQQAADLKNGLISAEQLHIKDKAREAAVLAAIEYAVKEHSFEVYYQPICRTDTQEFVAAEALIRLNDPALGSVSPAEFIPLAESNGSIIAIGNIVLEKVCDFISRHDLSELGLSIIDVNLSTIQVLQRNFISGIRHITSKYNVNPKNLSLEITETASNYSPAIFEENLAALIADGYYLALDDYGSGYSNLQRLVSTDFDVIKFDKEMIARTSCDEKFKDLLPRVQGMFHSMGADIVAEGVETTEQYEYLKSIGCDYIQGYLFSKALPEDSFVEFLRANKK